MVPHTPTIDGQGAHEQFFLVEKPGLDVAVMAGLEEASIRDNNDCNPDLVAV